MKIDQFALFDIEEDIKRIETILTTRIFHAENREHPLKQAAFTELIICLNDLLQKAKKFDVSVKFTDDVVITADVQNVTDAVSKMRNAVCHISSPLNVLSNKEDFPVKPTFIIMRGKVGAAIVIENKPVMYSDYEDDICFAYGNLKLYLYRHISRAYTEAKNNLTPLISKSQNSCSFSN